MKTSLAAFGVSSGGTFAADTAAPAPSEADLACLRDMGLPVLDSLPVIVEEARATRRTDARVNGAPTPDGIAFQRHSAFNWLIGYAGLGWDDMKTDI